MSSAAGQVHPVGPLFFALGKMSFFILYHKLIKKSSRQNSPRFYNQFSANEHLFALSLLDGKFAKIRKS